MPVLLPPGSIPASSIEDGKEAPLLPFLTDEDVLPLLRTALQAKRGFGTSPPTSFGQLFIDLLTRKQPALLERTRRFASDAASNTLAAHVPPPSPTTNGKGGGREGGKGGSQRPRQRFLYIVQHEWVVVTPGEGVDYIASDEATTCHLVAIRERGSGVVGLAHVDSPEAVEDLSAMEAAVEDRARAWRRCDTAAAAGAGAANDMPLALDLFIVGGYDGDSEAGLLTAVLLRHFVSESQRTYRLQLALVSFLNTSPHPSPSSSSSSSTVPAPTCRSLGFILASGGGSEGGQERHRGTPDLSGGYGGVFTGDVPKGLRGPKHTLRALRLWGWGVRNLIQVQVQSQKQKEIEAEAEAAAIPQLYNLRAAKKPSDLSKEDSSSSTSSSPSSSSSTATTTAAAAAAAAAATAAAAAEGGEEVVISITPFPFKPSKQIHALSLLSDEKLIKETSTSPAVESPSFIRDIRAVLTLLSTAKPEDFFGPSVIQALVVSLPCVDIGRAVEEEAKEG